jgi:hypothetical protein
MNDLLKEAENILKLADGREGPVDEKHAALLVIARALLVIAQELRKSNEQEDDRQHRQDMIDLYK